MMRTGLRGLAAVAALGLLWAHLPAAAQSRPDAQTWFKRHDRNADGRLDRGEFHQAVVEAFFFRDKDKNGVLAVVELKEASPESLKAVRRKSDAQITLQEYVNALFKDFEAADGDADGLLSLEEIERYRQVTR
jgi:Ca2+-binding EF-hand superfamily protein